MWIPSKGADFIAREDVEIACLLDLIVGGESLRLKQLTVVEVGVLLGTWSQVVLMNHPLATVVGIDPYPGPFGSERQNEMLAGMRKLGVDSRFELVPDWDDVDKSLVIDVAHIDGLHEEEAVHRDLLEASSRISEFGVIVVDDWRHAWFPGVASALYAFCASSEFRILGVTDNKAYLTRTGTFLERQNRFSKLVEQLPSVNVFSSVGEGQIDDDYVRRTDVSGYPVLLLRRNLTKRDSLIRQWLPPAAFSLALRMRSRGLLRSGGVRSRRV